MQDDGEVGQRPARIRLTENIRFAFALKVRAARLAEPFNANVEWWSCLKTAIKVRDRLMHPKWPEDIHITDEEFEATVKAYNGFKEQVLSYPPTDVE